MAATYGALGNMAHYASSFPPIPRAGTAVITIGAAPASSGGEERTVVRLSPREKPSTPAAGAAAKDAEKESVAVTYEGEVRVVTAFYGPAAKADAAALRKASVALVGKLRALKVSSAEVHLPSVEGIPAPAVASIVVQAVALTNYAFDRYITLEDKASPLVSAFAFVPSGASAEEASAAHVAAVLAECTVFARDLVNERADEMHPARLEAVARTVAAESGAAVHVLEGAALLEAGLHLLHAVGQSSRHAPRYVELVHKGDPDHPEDVIALVGKAITFDSGGLNIKPTGSMEVCVCWVSVLALCAGSQHVHVPLPLVALRCEPLPLLSPLSPTLKTNAGHARGHGGQRGGSWRLPRTHAAGHQAQRRRSVCGRRERHRRERV